MEATSTPVCPGESISSQLLESDPDLFPLVEAFVMGLNQRLCDIDAAAAEANWKDLRSLAHQLKGAGGSYGYPRISEAAARIEEFARGRLSDAAIESNDEATVASGDNAHLAAMLHELAAVAGAAQRGIVESRD